jgi:amino acid transporter
MGLAGSVGSLGLLTMSLAASGLMIVLYGGVSTMYAATGLVGVPLTFLVLALVLLPATVTFPAAARHLGHAATMYALAAQGLGRVAGVAVGAVALVSYAAIGCSLFGLLGVELSSTAGGPWWAWALAAWALIALLGGISLVANVVLIGVGVAAQLVVLVAVIVVAYRDPAEGISFTGFAPANLLTFGPAGLGGVLAFGIAAFIGYESSASYVEETRSPVAVRRAALAALLSLGVLYAVTAWAVGVGYGPAQVVDAARDPATSGLPLGLLGAAAPWAKVLLLVAIVLSMLSFHHLQARYLFRLGHEGVLPGWLGRVGGGARAGAPTTASLAQSGIGLAVIAVTAAAGVDPFTGLFIPASTLAAIGVLAMLTVASWAAGRYFVVHGGGANESWVTKRLAPILGVVCGAAVLAVVVAHLDLLLGVAPGAISTRLLPGIVAVVGLLGAGWGWWLRRHRPAVYAAIGQGQARRVGRLDPRLADLPL